MRSILFALFLATSFSAFCQTPRERDLFLADSLYRAGNYKASITYLDRLIQDYEKGGSLSSKTYITTVTYKTDALINISKSKEAIDFITLKTPLIEAIEEPDLGMISQFYSIRGELARVYSSDFSSAKQFYKKSLEYASQSDETRAKFLESNLYLGVLYADIGEYDSADSYFEVAAYGFEKLYGPNNYRVGGVYGQMASSELKKRNFWKSLSHSKKALSTSIWEVDSTLIDNSRYQESDSLNVFYADLFRLIDEKDILAKIHPIDAQIALLVLNAFSGMGDLEKAEELTLDAIKVFDATDQPLLTSNCQITLASIYSYRGQHKYAQSIYKQVEEAYREQGMYENELMAVLYDNMAETYQRMNQLDSAKFYTAKSLNISEKLFSPPHWRIAGMSFNLGRVHRLLGAPDSANFYFDKSEEAGFLPEGLINLNRALIDLERKEYTSAYKTALAALGHLSEAIDIYHVEALNTLGQISYDLGEIDSAVSYFDRSLDVAMGNYDFTKLEEITDFELYEDPMVLFDAVYWKADFLLKAVVRSNKPQFLPELLALTDFGSRLITGLRATFVVEDDNINFSKYIDRFIDICIEANIRMYDSSQDVMYIYEAFQYADLNKSQVLLRGIKSSVLGERENNSLLHKWAQLKKSIKAEETRIADLTKTQSGNTSEIQISKKRLNELQSDYDVLVNDLSENHPGIFYYIADGLGKLPFADFQEYLDQSKSMVIQYYIGQNKIYKFNLTGQTINYTLTTINDSLRNSIQSLSEFVVQNEATDKERYDRFIKNAFYLNEVLVGPLNTKEDTENLIIIPHDYLAKIPFEVLLTKKPKSSTIDFKNLPYLIQDFNISYASSASILSETTLNNNSDFSKAPAIGWAPFTDNMNLTAQQKGVLRNNQLEKLVGASKELQSITEDFNGQVFLKGEASETNFKKLTNNTKILHIATHGVVNQEAPEQSYLVFSKNGGDSLSDGMLHLYELYDMPLNSELTVLSACSTGDGELETGEGVMSLARGFTYAGSKSVVMSLWLANDNSTGSLIDGFYKHLAEDESKSEALRNSKLEYLESANNISSHPFYWAHLVSTGNNDPIVKQTRFPLIELLLAIILILAFAGYKKRQAQVGQS